jgi:DNA-binding NarL/FixJ family response regulator
LADDHTLVREGFRRILETEPGIEVVGEAADGRTAVECAERTKPDVVLMDLSMPELNGIEATRHISEKLRGPRVLCLSMHTGREMVAAMLRAGASGYLLKNCGSDELSEAVRVVASGGTFITPAIAGVVVDDFVRKRPARVGGAFDRLTNREREVLQLIAEGLTAKEVAFRLGVSQKTALAHRRHIMEKLHLHNDAELTRYALREGLTEL